jgi:hypothetical protein
MAKKKKLKPWHYVVFGVLGTLFLIVVLASIQTETLADEETRMVEPGYYSYLLFDADEYDKIDFDFKVVQGGPVNLLLLDAHNFVRYNDNETYFYYPEGSSNQVMGKSYSYKVERSGSYYILVENLNEEPVVYWSKISISS